MNSTDIDAWLQRWPHAARRVTPNAAAAKRLGLAAERSVRRARKALAEGDYDAAVIWAELALVNAADSVLQQHRVRVRAMERSHQARFDFPRLPSAFVANSSVIERARAERNAAAYEGGGRISKAAAEEIVQVATDAAASL